MQFFFCSSIDKVNFVRTQSNRQGHDIHMPALTTLEEGTILIYDGVIDSSSVSVENCL